ncbi:ABC transporter substrate-binding protein, partial [Streptomyces sp. NRRL F-6602]
DGDRPDPAKWGPEAPAGIPYLGASGALDEERLLSERPDLIVDVTYDGKHAYAVDDGAAERARLPVLALSVAVGLANGLIVAGLKVNAFIATLGTAFILRGW